VFRLVMRQDLGVVAVGLAAGVALAALAARAAGALLFGVTPGDAASYATGIVVLLAAGVVACVGPALRASRVDPVAIMK
jgi:ABC-type antimicrobial peptide transport system permease subunit